MPRAQDNRNDPKFCRIHNKWESPRTWRRHRQEARGDNLPVHIPRIPGRNDEGRLSPWREFDGNVADDDSPAPPESSDDEDDAPEEIAEEQLENGYIHAEYDEPEHVINDAIKEEAMQQQLRETYLHESDLEDPEDEGFNAITEQKEITIRGERLPTIRVDDDDTEDEDDYVDHLLVNQEDGSSETDEFDDGILEDPLSNSEIENSTNESLFFDEDSPWSHNLDPKEVARELRVQLAREYGIKHLDPEIEDDLIGFALRANGKTDAEYELWRAAFAHRMNLSSVWKSNKYGDEWSQLSALNIECCTNSCIAFDGEYADLDACPICKRKRRDPSRPPNIFRPISLIPRLQGMYQDPTLSHELNRDNRTPSEDPDDIGDKFDANHIQELRKRTVKVDGRDTGYKYFMDGRDISISLSLDGFTFYDRVGKQVSNDKYTCWLIIATIDNIDPKFRYKRKNVLILGVIPGPHAPVDLNSYLVWLKRELHYLAVGIRTWDADRREFFLLRAYLLFIFGDMPAIAHLLCMKGHNAKRPCRICYILGRRNEASQEKTYYPALLQPGEKRRIKISTLVDGGSKARTHEGHIADVEDILQLESTGTKAALETQQKSVGVNGRSILLDLDSFSISHSAPHDLAHLGGLNTIPNLVLIWTGKFKKHLGNQGTGNYVLSAQKWATVGKRGEEAMQCFPSEFCRIIPNVSATGSSMNGEAWFVWFTLIAPYALDGILPDPYYRHAMDLVRIIRFCMNYSIKRSDVSGPFTAACHKWVTEYEELYYQGQASRLSFCMSTIHAWIHLPQDILNSGPSWMNWAFPMEREVQWAKSLVQHSRRRPFAYLANRALRREQVKQLCYRLQTPRYLDPTVKSAKSIEADEQEQVYRRGPKREQLMGPYSGYILRSKLERDKRVPETVRTLIINHIAGMFQLPNDVLQTTVPQRMDRWQNLEIAGGGDRISTALCETRERDASFIRYHTCDGVSPDVEIINYGQLQYIVKFTLPAIQDEPSRVFVLAVIMRCETQELDASQGPVYYSTMNTTFIVDLTCIQSVVGRVPMGNGRFGIVDRGMETSWPTVHQAVVDNQ